MDDYVRGVLTCRATVSSDMTERLDDLERSRRAVLRQRFLEMFGDTGVELPASRRFVRASGLGAPIRLAGFVHLGR